MSEDLNAVRDRALRTLDLIRDALVDGSLPDALTQIDVLQGQLVEWRRADARRWLDDALAQDVLLFNVDAARQRLDQWAGTLMGGADDSVLRDYREQVTGRIEQKHRELQVRGVVSHCQELWSRAQTEERRESAPHPDHIIKSYIRPAYEVARSAQLEYPQDPRVQSLVAQASQLLDERERAARVYVKALENNLYADALDTLASLQVVEGIPRFSLDAAGQAIYQNMVSISEAQQEIMKMGRAWADAHIATLLQQVHDHLEAHQPQTALDVLEMRKRVERFAEATISAKLREFEQRANEDLRKLQHAERRGQQALQVLNDNPMGAWDVYREAHNVYPGAPSLPATRERILGRLISDLEEQASQAESAFDARLMDQVGVIYQRAREVFSDKAPELETLLARLEEIDWQARTYMEYRGAALAALEQIRSLLPDDIRGASDVLGRLEEMPSIVLDDLPGLGEARGAIRRQMHVEMAYNRLYQLLYSDSIETVEAGLSEVDEFTGEIRFEQLRDDLEVHLTYLNGHVEYAVGQLVPARRLFMQVAGSEGHPDQVEAQRMVAEIDDQAARADGVADDEQDEDAALQNGPTI